MEEFIGRINIVIYIYISFFGLYKFFVKDKILMMVIGI